MYTSKSTNGKRESSHIKDSLQLKKGNLYRQHAYKSLLSQSRMGIQTNKSMLSSHNNTRSCSERKQLLLQVMQVQEDSIDYDMFSQFDS